MVSTQKSETPTALTQGYRERSFQRGGPVVKMYTVLRKSGSEFIEPNNDDDDDDHHHHHHHHHHNNNNNKFSDFFPLLRWLSSLGGRPRFALTSPTLPLDTKEGLNRQLIAFGCHEGQVGERQEED